MPSGVAALLHGRGDLIDFDEIQASYTWLDGEHHTCILSPDSDGILCGLFMNYYKHWKVGGFYDNKVLVIDRSIDPRNCIFLDGEIFRRDIRSIGHHMLLYNKRSVPSNWSNFDNCLQPNLMRGHDYYHDFRLKYPLATIHLLLAIIGTRLGIELPPSAVCPLLFTDGTYQNLFGYPENVLDWLRYLRASIPENPLRAVFLNDRYTVYDLMVDMDSFFRRRDTISIRNERGDRLRLSSNLAEPVNLVEEHPATFAISEDARARAERFISILSELTGWDYDSNKWTWRGLRLERFSKSEFGQEGRRLNNTTFTAMVISNPLSWAITAANRLEYTMEQPGRMSHS